MTAARIRTPRVPVSWGEVIDKLTILEIKCERMTDAAVLKNVRRERTALVQEIGKLRNPPAKLAHLRRDLKKTNAKLWQIEDDIRAMDARSAFGRKFVALARAVYRTNDERARLKREINLLLSSGLIEEKQYRPYGGAR